MEIYNKAHSEQSLEVEPIRSNVVTLILKIMLTLFLFEMAYSTAFFLLNLGFSVPYDLHHHMSAFFLIANLAKILIEILFIAWLVLSWASNTYFLTDKHLIRRTGIWGIHEDVFHFANLRSISVTQSILGKILDYGDVTLITSASGGYQGDVTLLGISSPQKYERMLKTSF